MKRYHVGVKANGKREVFRAKGEPTQATHGATYNYCIGPFRSKRGAGIMAAWGHNNPHLQTVADAERMAKHAKESS